MQKSILDNRLVYFVLNTINDVFWFGLGLFLAVFSFTLKITTPLDYLVNTAFFLVGVLFIVTTIFSYTTARKLDKIFKQKILSDSNIDTLYASTSFWSGKVLVRFRMNRALMYSRAIAMPKDTKKNDRYPWFNNYDFKKDVSVFDKLLILIQTLSLFGAVVCGIAYLIVSHA